MDTTILFQIFPDWLNFFFLDIMSFKIVDTKFLVIMPGWAIAHLLAGFIIMYFILKFDDDNLPFLTVFLLLLVFESFEFLISYVAEIIFREVLVDTLFDLFIGMVGATIAWFIWRKR